MPGGAPGEIVVADFRRMWVEIGWGTETFREDWADVVAAFVERARADDDFAAFVVKLHASRHGEPVYRAMGFCDTNELSRALPGSGAAAGAGGRRHSYGADPRYQ